MTLKDEERKFLVESHLNKARKALHVAEKNLDIDPGTSARLSYDAAFHATTALFICERIQVPSTHEGLNDRLYELFVRSERAVSAEIAAILGKLEKDRNIAAYRVTSEISEKEAMDDLNAAHKYFNVFHTMIDASRKRTEIEQQCPTKDNEILESEISDLKLIKGTPRIYTQPNAISEYAGKILHVDEQKGYSVQLTGKISLIVHQHKNLEKIPKVGEIVKINYKKNKIGMVTLVQRSRKNGQEMSV